MLSKVFSYGINGLEGYIVTIEVDVARGLPATIIVGLPDSAIRESKERVRAAIKNSGYQFGAKRITINLSPADVKKEGPSFDLAVALGILAATDQIQAGRLVEYAMMGELSLDGRIQPVNGALPAALAAQNQFKGILVPEANAAEAAMAQNINVYPVRTLTDVVHFLGDPSSRRPHAFDPSIFLENAQAPDIDFSDIKGQAHVKRGLEIAAAGNHNILLIGPPGSGKSMLAKRMPTILPDMDLRETLETTQIHSVMGLLSSQNRIMTRRPFRSPHHTTSDVAIVGGGSVPKPGEVTLSHNGVLFLDELPEFNRNVLESLRQPIEDQFVCISRAVKSARFPSRFLLIGAMNPCPCGNFGSVKSACRCSPAQVERYRSRISGPLLDRIDIHVEVPAVPYSELSNRTPSESSLEIKGRVNKARNIQLERFKESADFVCNGQMSHKQSQKYCALGKTESDLMRQAMTELHFSARAHDKILKVSRTIADLAGAQDILPEHIAEAIQYRSLDRGWWG